MRVTLGVIVAMLVLPRIASAGGIVLEVKPSRTDYGATLSRHVDEPELPLDGGLMSIGWWFGAWQINATLMGHDVVTVNGGYDDNFMMAGVDVRHHRALSPRLDLALRGGVFQAGIYGVQDTPLEAYRGGGLRVGAGLRYRTVTCGDTVLNLTVEVVGNQLWLASDGAKDIQDHTTSVLLGLEYTQTRNIGKRCAW